MAHQQDPSSGDSHAVVVDIQSLAQALGQELAGRRRLLHGGSQARTLTIGMVPKLTRNVDEHEYNPHYVAIGPYHRYRKNISRDNIDRDEDKLACLDIILSAASPGTGTTTVEPYLTELSRIEDDARSFYAYSFNDMTSLEFLRMLLLDGCYVLNRFVSVVPGNGAPVANGHAQGGYQASSTAPAAAQLEAVSVVRDVLYLAENQIPYFVIDKIHKLTFPGSSGVPAVNAIAGYISSILQRHQYSMATVADNATPPPAPGNLLHLLHMHFPKPKSTNSATGKRPVGRCRTATEYYINGVSFRSRRITAGAEEDEAHCILDVAFDRGTETLALPRLNIDAETWRILRNLIALEQQNPTVGSHVTAYCVFMSQLACTAADVELLSRRGVITHLLGNNEQVAELFSDLCKGVVFDADDADRNYLRGTIQELDRCYGSRLRRWMALLSQKYFASPWVAIGVMAAAIVLLCTLVQALYAILSYYKPRGS